MLHRTFNHPTAGRIPGGAMVERAAPAPDLSARIRLQLHETDFATASRIAEATMLIRHARQMGATTRVADEWRDRVGRYCSGNSAYLVGGSSTGKTTARIVREPGLRRRGKERFR